MSVSRIRKPRRKVCYGMRRIQVARFTISSRCRRASRTQIVTRQSSRSRRDAQARSLSPTIPRKRRPPCPPAAAQRGLEGNDAARALSGEGFETASRRAPANELTFRATRPAQKLPPGITATAKYRNLDSESRALQQQHQDMKQQLAKVRAEKQKNGASKPQRGVQEANIKDKDGAGSRVANSTIPENAGLLSSRVQRIGPGPKTRAEPRPKA